MVRDGTQHVAVAAVPSGLTVPVFAAANDVENGPRVQITWLSPSNPNGRLLSYTLVRDGMLLVNLSINTTSFLDTTVKPAVLYRYLVQAHTPAGTGESALAAVRVPDGRPEGVTPPEVLKHDLLWISSRSSAR